MILIDTLVHDIVWIGIGAKRDFTKEGVEIVNLPPSLTRNFDGEFTCDNIKERRKDY